MYHTNETTERLHRIWSKVGTWIHYVECIKSNGILVADTHMDKPLAWVSIKMKTSKNLFYSQTTALKHWNTMNATDKVQIC